MRAISVLLLLLTLVALTPSLSSLPSYPGEAELAWSDEAPSQAAEPEDNTGAPAFHLCRAVEKSRPSLSAEAFFRSPGADFWRPPMNAEHVFSVIFNLRYDLPRTLT